MPHGNRFVRYLIRTLCFYICYVNRQQLVRNYRTRTPPMRYSVYNDIFFIGLWLYVFVICRFIIIHFVCTQKSLFKILWDDC